MISRSNTFFLMMLFALIRCGLAHADDFEFALDGIVSERSELKSGVCTISGKMINETGGGGESSLSGPFQVFLAFEGEKLRFDRTELSWVIDSASLAAENEKRADTGSSGNGQLPQEVPSKKTMVTKHYLRTPPRAAFWVEGQPLINVTDALDMKLFHGVGAFDVKCLGLYSYHEFSQGLDLKDVVAAYRSAPKVTKSVDSEHNWEFTLLHSDSKWSVTLDPARSMSPISARLEEKTPAGEYVATQTVSCKWKEQAGVWLPTSYTMERTDKTGQVVLAYVFDLEWEYVNEDVDDSLFDYASLDAPESVGIIDFSLGAPIVIRDAKPLMAIAQANRSKNWRFGLLLLGVATVVGVLCYALIRFRPRLK
jgi:hypothetical protein